MLTPVHARLVLFEVLPPFIALAGESVGGGDIDDWLASLRAAGEPASETDDLLADRDAETGDSARAPALDRLDEGIALRLADEILDIGVRRSPYDEWDVLT